MAETSYLDGRVQALQAELEQIATAIPKLQGQLEQLTSRRLMLHGALLELQDLLKQQNGKVTAPSESLVSQESV